MFSAFRELWLLVGGPEPTAIAVASMRETQTAVARPYEFRESPLVRTLAPVITICVCWSTAPSIIAVFELRWVGLVVFMLIYACALHHVTHSTDYLMSPQNACNFSDPPAG